jgi:hypothetical protein
MAGARALPALSEARVLEAMLGWRRGVGALEPWFRATPFAAALHHREHRPRTRPRTSASEPSVSVDRLLRSLPAPDPRALWIFDLPGPLALWLAYGLRRRFGLASALAWNGWYDPRGVLDGSEEIPLLLSLGRKLARIPARRGGCLIFDSARHADKKAGALDNRYALGEEDAPSLEHLGEMDIRRVRAWTWEAPGEDLSAYLGYLRTRLPVTVTVPVAVTSKVASRG